MGKLSEFLNGIFGGSQPEEEEEPFVEPYDFYIEADERYNASKTVQTSDPRGIDPIEILENMDLCYDVTNHSGVRHKLKKLFDEAAFEAGTYASYEGGREVSLSASEDIDERELEITVTISRASDDAPFEAAIEIGEAADDDD